MKHDFCHLQTALEASERSRSVGLVCSETVGSGNSKFLCSHASLQLRHSHSRFRSCIMPAVKYNLAFRGVNVVKIMLTVNFIFRNLKGHGPFRVLRAINATILFFAMLIKAPQREK